MNTLKIAKDLQNAGLDAKAAEAISISIHDSIETKAATKLDLMEVKNELKEEIYNVRSELKEELLKTEIRIKDDFTKQLNSMLVKIVSLMGFVVMLFVAYIELRFK